MKSKELRPAGPRTTFILFGILCLLFIMGGYAFYHNVKKDVKTNNYNELKAIADLKIRQIVSWRKDLKADAAMYSTGLIRTKVLEWLATPNDHGIETDIRRRLQVIRDYQGYENIILAGTDGKILMSMNPALKHLEPVTRQWVTRAISSRNSVFGDLFRCPKCHQVHLDVVAPIFGKANLPVAVFILRSDPARNLYPLVQSWPLPSRSAETLIIRRDGDDILFLNTLRHRPDPALTFRIPLSRVDLPASRAALGRTGMFSGKDYRGVDVLTDIRHVPNSPWYMVAKVDTNEILSEARWMGIFIGLATLMLSLLAGASAGYAYKHKGKRTFQALYQAERNQRETEEEFKATLYSIGDAVITTDVAGRIRQMNPVAENLTGWTETEAAGMPVEDVFAIVSEETGDKIDSPGRKVIENGLIVGLANHTLLISKDGDQIPIADSGAPIRDEDGDISGVVLVFRDQTRERDMDRMLRARLKLLEESEARFRRLYKNSPVAYHSLDARGNILDINETWLAELGYTREEVIGKWFGDFLAGNGPADFESGFEAFKSAGELHGVEFEVTHKDGKILTMSFEGRIGRNADNAFERTHCVLVNMTERKALENQLRQAQKMDAVGRLAGGVAHDFNNMLMVIIGNTELAINQIDPEKPVFKDLQAILNAAKRSANLTRQLLAFARKQTISPVVLDVNDTISGMLKLLRRLIGENIDLTWQPGPDIRPVTMDPAQVDQIMANLLVNARDAIDGVGAVTIETDNVEFDENYCADHAGFVPGHYVMIAVTDTGAGMGKETLDRVFEPFFTTKGMGKGTGLGLSTIYGIVKQNNGFINLYSEPDQGTTFKIYIPRTETGIIETAVSTAGKVENLRGSETVLLVEDEAAILKLGTSILEKYGYTVLPAKDPVEALEAAADHDKTIHLLVTDVVMPKMNGRELAEKLNAARPGIKCLFMSGYTANAIAHNGVLDKGAHFLQKPFSVTTLAEKVREVLDNG